MRNLIVNKNSFLFCALLVVAQSALAAPPLRRSAPGDKSATKTAAKSAARAPAKAAAKPTVKGKAVAKLPSKVIPHAAPSSEGMGWVNEVRSASRVVQAMDPGASASGVPHFGESLALAFDSYYLIVPWRFISDAWSVREGSLFFVQGGASPVEARLTDIDLAGGVALLKTDQPMAGTMSRDRLRLDYPSVEEPFFALASRDWLRQGARFLRAKSDATAIRYQLALGTNETVTTRFVFDRSGKLVAISDGHPENEGWSGTSKSVLDLLRRQDSPRPASVATSEQARRQVYFWQDRWTNAITPNPSTVSLQPLECRAQLHAMQDPKVAAAIRNVRTLACQNRMPLELGAGYTAGVKIWSGDVSFNSPLDPESNLASAVEKSLSEEAFSDLDHQASLVNLITVPQCDQMVVTNSRGEKNRVRFCTSALKSAAGLGDTALSVVSMPEGSAGSKLKYVVARMKGFDEAHSRRVLEAMVENVRSLP